jgi:ketosteroid isomerase-like protein
MLSTDVLTEMFIALDKGDDDKVRSLLDRDFEFSGPAPEPIGAEEFIAFERALHQALPNLRHNGVVYSEDSGDWVRGEVHVTGTHRGVLELPMLPKVIPTRKKVTLSPERFLALVRDGKILSFAAEVGPDGGLIGILKQIGRKDLADCLGIKGADCRTIGQDLSAGTHA